MIDEQEEPYLGPERRRPAPNLYETFRQATQQAAEQAAQRVAEIHRRRLVIQCFLAALVVSSGIMLIGLFIFRSEAESTAHANALYDCRLFERSAGLLADYVTADAALRATLARQGLGRELSSDFQKIIKKQTLVKLATQQQAANKANAAHGLQIARALTAIAAQNCITHLGG